ncbi:MAG: hypothetical protein IJ071_11680 [Ruminococcus sp.]|nr:hypothetical protein [Ruminococcus sp.]
MGGFLFILLFIVVPLVINAAKNGNGGGKETPAQKRRRELEKLRSEVSARKAQEDQRKRQEDERRRIDEARRRKEEENRRAREAKKRMEELRAAYQAETPVKQAAPVKASAPVKAEAPKVKQAAPVNASAPVKSDIPEAEALPQETVSRDQIGTERVFTARRYLMDISKYPSKVAVDKAMEEDRPLMAVLSFDGMSAFVCRKGDAADHTGLLAIMGRLSSEENSFFKICFTKDHAEWLYDCPESYRVIPYADRRRETYFSDGLTVIKDFLGAVGYSPRITIPEEHRRGFQLPEIK